MQAWGGARAVGGAGGGRESREARWPGWLPREAWSLSSRMWSPPVTSKVHPLPPSPCVLHCQMGPVFPPPRLAFSSLSKAVSPPDTTAGLYLLLLATQQPAFISPCFPEPSLQISFSCLPVTQTHTASLPVPTCPLLSSSFREKGPREHSHLPPSRPSPVIFPFRYPRAPSPVSQFSQ